MKRPELNEVPLQDALQKIGKNGTMMITMSVNQWDRYLEFSYQDGWILLELDDDEKPIRAFQRHAS